MKTFLGKDLSNDDYCGLLLSTAQQYDQQHAKKGNTTVKRRIYQHDSYSNYEPDDYHNAESYDIDHPLSMIEAHATNFTQGPHLSYDQWHALPDDAKKIWDTLGEEAKAIILRSPPKPDPNRRVMFQRPPDRNGTPPPRCPFQPHQNVNVHDLEYLVACLHELHGGGDTRPSLQDTDGTSIQEEDATQEEVQQEQPLLAHMTKKKPLSPGNVKCLLSPAANNKDNKSVPPQEVNLNGIVYRQVSMASMRYTNSSCHAASKSSLVD